MKDPLERLRHLTRARIALGRVGDGLPTEALLNFTMAHALARDAVHSVVEWATIAEALRPLETVKVSSAAQNKTHYLRRPDLGRVLAADQVPKLPRGPFDLVFVIGDGLSAEACMKHAVETVQATLPLLKGFTIGPVVLAQGARVALSDPIGEAMQAQLVIMLIGERPGLTSADSLGAYLTFAPCSGRQDSERNCISNIHAHGLPPAMAAGKLAWLAREALRLKLTGVALKEAAPDILPPAHTAPKLG